MAGTHPHLAPDEFVGRLARIRAALRKAGVAVGLFDEIEALAWLTGYGNSENRWRCVASGSFARSTRGPAGSVAQSTR
jgi:hypothetical protein